MHLRPRTMKQTTIFWRPSLRPASLPYDRRHAHKLTKIIWQQAIAMGIDPPFGLDRMSDRMVVRELKRWQHESRANRQKKRQNCLSHKNTPADPRPYSGLDLARNGMIVGVVVYGQPSPPIQKHAFQRP